MENLQPQTGKMHTWIIVLLVWVVALLLFVAGYMLYGRRDVAVGPSATEIASACIGVVSEQLTKGTDNIDAPTCPDVATTEEVEAGANRPGFLYPADWTVSGEPTADDNSVNYIIRLDPGAVLMCGGCDGPWVPVTIITEEKDDATLRSYISFEAYVNSLYADENIWEDVKITKVQKAGGTMYDLTAHQKGGLRGPLDTNVLIFEGANTMVTVRYEHEPGDTSLDADWNIIKNSLDFSKIE